ncbi:class I SAM-dependent methyltransferase [bacterium]|nr:class I SAM-dependent methyltransferase [bacterium]
MPKSNRKQSRRLAVRALIVIAVVATVVDAIWVGFSAVAVLAVGILVVLLNIALRVREQIESVGRRQLGDWQQLQHLAGLYSALDVRLPLPGMREWAASPDLLATLAMATQTRRPRVVVEASCGVSTLVIGYCLERLAADGHHGHVYSLEQSREYAVRCREQVSAHGLDKFVTVLHAPLRDHDGIKWYDMTELPEGLEIDMLVIDGPSPGQGSDERVRAPAMPLLHNRLSDDAVVYLDDGDRLAERETVRIWQQEFPEWTAEYLTLEKGAWCLKRRVQDDAM